MSRLIASTELLVSADHRMFGLCDDGPDGPFSAPTPSGGDGWLGVGTYEVMVGTAQDGLRVRLRLEAWDGEPDDEGDETVSAGFPSGLVCVNEITGGIKRDVFTLPAPGDYYIQLSTEGGPETAYAYSALFDQFDVSDPAFEAARGALEGQESFTARFWPLR